MTTRTIRHWFAAALALLAGFGDPARSAALEPPGQGAAPPVAPECGWEMVACLHGQLGTRVGGGECAHVATQALRVAGADFTYMQGFLRPNEARGKDYVWTPNRVARLTSGSEVAGKRFRPGDILQFHDAAFSSGTEVAHHTQVVAAVDPAGRITQVYEENAGTGADKRRLQLNPAIDLAELTGGRVSVYRAVPRRPRPGWVEYVIVNNTAAGRTVTVGRSGQDSQITLDRSDTSGSFVLCLTKFTGAAPVVLQFGTAALTLENGGAYELFTGAGGRAGLRRI